MLGNNRFIGFLGQERKTDNAECSLEFLHLVPFEHSPLYHLGAVPPPKAPGCRVFPAATQAGRLGERERRGVRDKAVPLPTAHLQPHPDSCPPTHNLLEKQKLVKKKKNTPNPRKPTNKQKHFCAQIVAFNISIQFTLDFSPIHVYLF